MPCCRWHLAVSTTEASVLSLHDQSCRLRIPPQPVLHPLSPAAALPKSSCRQSGSTRQATSPPPIFDLPCWLPPHLGPQRRPPKFCLPVSKGTRCLTGKIVLKRVAQMTNFKMMWR